MTIVCTVYDKGIFPASATYFHLLIALASHPVLLCGELIRCRLACAEAPLEIAVALTEGKCFGVLRACKEK